MTCETAKARYNTAFQSLLASLSSPNRQARKSRRTDEIKLPSQKTWTSDPSIIYPRGTAGLTQPTATRRRVSVPLISARAIRPRVPGSGRPVPSGRPSRAFFSFPPRAAAPVPTPAAINNRPFPPQLRLRSPPNPSFFLCAFPRFQLPSRQRRLASPPIPFPDRIPLETVKAKNQPRAAAVTRTRRAC